MTDLGVSAVVGAPRLDNLDLSETRITDAGLSRLHSLPKLRQLRLNRTAITDACVEHLVKIKDLRRLEIAGTGLSDSAIQRLKAAVARLPDRPLIPPVCGRVQGPGRRQGRLPSDLVQVPLRVGRVLVHPVSGRWRRA